MDSSHRLLAGQARDDFDRARRRAFMGEIGSFFSRRPNTLLSFAEVQAALPLHKQVYRGMQQVPVVQIHGSVDRYADFDRNFLPTQTHTRPRWEAIDRATLALETLPPIQLYQVGDVYFVKDGNHRVSVARQQGQELIDAEVIECPTPVPITTETDAQELLHLAEYARFLQQTRLDKLRPGVSIRFGTLGRYDTLLEHISAHRWYMGIEQKREIRWDEAVQSWYDTIYRPLVDVIESSGILADFPGRTAGDLYLWIMDYRYYLEKNTGQQVGPATAVLHYDATYGRWTRRVVRRMRRLLSQAAHPLPLLFRTFAGVPEEESPAAD